MLIKRFLSVVLFCLSLLTFFAPVSFAEDRSSTRTEPMIITGNAMMADIVRDLLPDATIKTLIVGTACPGHEMIGAKEVRSVASADAVIIADWQIKQLHPIFEAADVHDKIRIVKGQESWLIPSVQKRVSNDTAHILTELFPEKKREIASGLDLRIKSVEKIENLCDEIKTLCRGKPVFSALMQSEFARFLGFDVPGTFTGTEDLSVLKLRRLTEIGKKRNVCLVIENLQSGADTGKPLADTLNIPQAVLSNFPMETEQGYYRLMCDNLSAIRAALEKR